MESLDSPRNHSSVTPREPYHFETLFPAWVPAVTVASGMILFLAASFYLRHRKVVKKREILMDYFYIIFQYGGMRRKRMVAALCNTNAITLRELGRSFMISFDSMGHSENNPSSLFPGSAEAGSGSNCPYYLEDTAFTAANANPVTPGAQKRNFFKSKIRASVKKSWTPFRRFATQSEDHPSTHANPMLLQDILKKFKTRRPPSGPPSAHSTPGRRVRGGYWSSPHHLQGSSMCTIHGDDFDFHKLSVDKDSPQPFVLGSQNLLTPRLAEVAAEARRHSSLGNLNPERLREELSAAARLGQDHPLWGGQTLHPPNLPAPGEGGQGRVNTRWGSSSSVYRSSEPTILIQGASTDSDCPPSLNDIRRNSENSLVVLRRVSKGDGDHFYYEEQRLPPMERTDRASLSKVSSVRSGNMNEYYHCLHSPVKKKSNPNSPVVGGKSGAKKWNNKSSDSSRSSAVVSGPPRSKRSRLSLGEIGVSNFNRRIVDFPSDSLPEYDPESSADSSRMSRGSSVHSKGKPRTAWTRFKNVFSGSRAAQSGDSHQSKVSKSSQSSVDERPKRRSRRQHKRWDRFINVFTGFRSLPESKESGVVVPGDGPPGSTSVPLGLDSRVPRDLYHVIEMESGDLHFIPRSPRLPPRGGVRSEEYRPHHLSPGSKIPPKALSFPDEIFQGHEPYKKVHHVVGGSRSFYTDAAGGPHSAGKLYHIGDETPPPRSASFSLPHSKSMTSAFSTTSVGSHEDWRGYYSDIPSPYRRARTPSRLEGNDSEEDAILGRRFRSLSPLPERSFSFSPRRTKPRPHKVPRSPRRVINPKSSSFHHNQPPQSNVSPRACTRHRSFSGSRNSPSDFIMSEIKSSASAGASLELPIWNSSPRIPQRRASSHIVERDKNVGSVMLGPMSASCNTSPIRSTPSPLRPQTYSTSNSPIAVAGTDQYPDSPRAVSPLFSPSQIPEVGAGRGFQRGTVSPSGARAHSPNNVVSRTSSSSGFPVSSPQKDENHHYPTADYSPPPYPAQDQNLPHYSDLDFRSQDVPLQVHGSGGNSSALSKAPLAKLAASDNMSMSGLWSRSGSGNTVVEQPTRTAGAVADVMEVSEPVSTAQEDQAMSSGPRTLRITRQASQDGDLQRVSYGKITLTDTPSQSQSGKMAIGPVSRVKPSAYDTLI